MGDLATPPAPDDTTVITLLQTFMASTHAPDKTLGERAHIFWGHLRVAYPTISTPDIMGDEDTTIVFYFRGPSFLLEVCFETMQDEYWIVQDTKSEVYVDEGEIEDGLQLSPELNTWLNKLVT